MSRTMELFVLRSVMTISRQVADTVLAVDGASCYIIRDTLFQQRTSRIAKQVSLVHDSVITLTGLYTLVQLTHSDS